jgi:hypothetical protein
MHTHLSPSPSLSTPSEHSGTLAGVGSRVVLVPTVSAPSAATAAARAAKSTTPLHGHAIFWCARDEISNLSLSLSQKLRTRTVSPSCVIDQHVAARRPNNHGVDRGVDGCRRWCCTRSCVNKCEQGVTLRARVWVQARHRFNGPGHRVISLMNMQFIVQALCSLHACASSTTASMGPSCPCPLCVHAWPRSVNDLHALTLCRVTSCTSSIKRYAPRKPSVLLSPDF